MLDTSRLSAIGVDDHLGSCAYHLSRRCLRIFRLSSECWLISSEQLMDIGACLSPLSSWTIKRRRGGREERADRRQGQQRRQKTIERSEGGQPEIGRRQRGFTATEEEEGRRTSSTQGQKQGQRQGQ